MTLRPGIERRITLRLLAYWEKLRGDRPMPSESDIRSEDILDLWDSCLLIPVKNLVRQDYTYTYMGPGIAEAFKLCLSGDNTHRLERGYARVIATMKPVLEEGEFKSGPGEVIKYRQCLLPVGDDGEVKAVFGGMRYKIFAVREINPKITAT
jgi:hypothetical protein